MKGKEKTDVNVPPTVAFAIALVVTTTEELLSNFAWTENVFMTEAFVLCVTFALKNIIKEVWRGFLFF